MQRFQSGSDVVLTKYHRIYRVQWCRNGYGYVTSTVTGSFVASYTDGAWSDDGRLPDDVRAFAMSVRPEVA